MVIAEQRRTSIERPLASQHLYQGSAPTGCPVPHQAKQEAAVRKCAMLTLVVLAGFALCLLYTYQISKIIALGYQAEQVQKSVADLQRENSQLELEAAELQTPERIAQIATTKFGMQEPQNFLVASCSLEQGSPQGTQVQAPAPPSSWGARLLAAIPSFVGRAEASPQ